ncbi:hypothetical protein ES708_32207 [subsurface metagenome]
MKWIKKWKVKSENGNDVYVVALSDKNEWGCSCPAWKFRRIECKHIIRVKLNPDRYEIEKPLAMVDVPIYKEKENKLLIPLIRIEPYNWKMEALICYTMAKHGYLWKEIKEIRHLNHIWTLKKVNEIVKYHY